MDRYEASGLEFDLTDDGPADGEVVILLHGFPETRKSWDGVIPHLVGAGYRVLAPDQRGYSPGARPTDRAAYRLDRLAGDVLALADASGTERFHVVGHDWGAAVAWGLAGWHPERLITMTSLATPHPRALMRSFVTSSQLARSWYMLALQVPRLPERLLAGRGKAVFLRSLVDSGLDEARAAGYVEFLTGDGAATGPLNWYRAIGLTPPWKIAGPSVPVMYVYGAHDFALGRKAALGTGRWVEGDYRFEVLETAGHWLPEEVPELIGRLVLEHIGRYGSSSAGGS